MTQGSKLLAAAMAMLVAGCAGTELQKAESVEPTGSAFSKGLYAGYLARASDEYGEGDYSESDISALKAIDAGAGQKVQPTVISAVALPSDKVDILSSARERLMAALAAGAAEKAPASTARAQVNFDCWVEEQVENRQPKDIAACKGEFFAALNLTNKAMTPKPMAAAPAPAPVPKPETFILYFATGSSRLDDAAQAVLREVRAAASKLDGPKVTVAGFADTVGSEGDNLALSDRRAAAIVAAMSGIAEKIEALGLGQNELAVPTDDGVDEPRNRRVTITVSP